MHLHLQRILTLVFILFSCWKSPQAQAPSNPKTKVIDSLLSECQQKGIFNGVALVADQGKIILHKGYGDSDLLQGTPVKLKDRFYIGSLTKQFTSALILLLQEEALLSIEDPISQYLPEFDGVDYQSITIHHLLTHTSGLGSYTSHPQFDRALDYQEDEFLQFIKEPLHFQPGSSWQYSNSGYYLLGLIAERVTGKPYGYLLEHRIFRPLKMRRTGFKETWLKKKVAKGFWRTIDGYAPMPRYSLSSLFSTGGIFSTAGDLFKWNEALYGSELLSSTSKKILFTPVLKDYACGWYVKKGIDQEGEAFERHFHGGWIKGYHAFILRRIPDQQLVVLLDNAYNQEIPTIKNRIWSALIEEPLKEVKPKLSNLLFHACAEKRVLPLLDSIHENLDHFESRFIFEEFDINTVAYRLMENDRFEEAGKIFAFNLARYPEAWNVYDSMGELQLHLGNEELAQQHYLKSLELNPANVSAELALEKIQKALQKQD